MPLHKEWKRLYLLPGWHGHPLTECDSQSKMEIAQGLFLVTDIVLDIWKERELYAPFKQRWTNVYSFNNSNKKPLLNRPAGWAREGERSCLKFSSLIFKSVCKGHVRCFERLTQHYTSWWESSFVGLPWGSPETVIFIKYPKLCWYGWSENQT